ncbi:uncharacterized protein FRV6_16611 [Fusarium oxysporum]|uniref:Apple domain-containing protein n=1 Tax=Fusarium oxysporum TaxID=5507 RepID=A0A2H3TV32_FUSOX|nr:uncharacterized protein FRV6_16611 [Fusarium oxysporum]
MIVFNLLFLATGISALLVDRQSENSNRECAHWCSENFRNPGAVCTSLAAQGRGPCFECGPAAPEHPAKPDLCSETCTNILTDPNNCGECGHKCRDTDGDDDTYCHNGVCQDDYDPCLDGSTIISLTFGGISPTDFGVDVRIGYVEDLECCRACYTRAGCAYWYKENGLCTIDITTEPSSIGVSDQCPNGLVPSKLVVHVPGLHGPAGKGPCIDWDSISIRPLS